MKNNSIMIFATFLLVMILALGGCSKSGFTTVMPRATITIPSTSTAILLSATPIFPSKTPTVSADQLQKNLISLLQDEKCALPCLMGINPISSTIVDAHNLLLPFQTLTQYGSLPIDSEGGLSIRYPLDAITSAYIDINYFPSAAKQGMLDHLFLHTVAATAGGKGDDPTIFADIEYQQLLQRYSLSAILTNFGRPTQVFVSVMPSTGAEPGVASFFDLRLAYPDKGFYVSYYSLAQEPNNSYEACPSNSFISLWSEVPVSGLSTDDLIAKMDNWPGFDFVLGFKPLEQSTNMTVDQFYQTFSQPIFSCIDTPKSAWPTH